MRIARGSGHKVQDVMEMIKEYKRLAKVMSKMKGQALSPHVLKKMGGVRGLESFMKNMAGSNKGGARL